MPGTMLKSEDKNENQSNNLVKESKKLKIVVNMVTQDERKQFWKNTGRNFLDEKLAEGKGKWSKQREHIQNHIS